jgi:excisionase family DNA binding protein
MNANNRPTLAEVQSWPATVTVTEAALALGISRSTAYKKARDGTLPVTVIRVGERVVVVTDSLLRLLSG